MSGALFGGGRAAAAAKTSLVEFRAGKMTLGGDNMVTADKRKGLIIVDQTDDQLMHFQWKDRATGNIEDDLIIFPDDIEFKKVPQCTTGRVFLLKFKSSNRKMLFWMQEPKTDKDDEYCKKVNDYLNNPPAPGSASRSGGSSGGGLGSAGLDLNNLGDSELQSLLNNMSQQQLMQLFGSSLSGGSGGLGGLASLLGAAQSPSSGGRQRSTAARANREAAAASTAAAAAPPAPIAAAATSAAAPAAATAALTEAASAATSSAPIQLADLQSILSGIQMPTEAAGAASGPQVDLARGLTAEVMKPLLANPTFVRKMKDLLPAEHQGENLEDEIKGTVQSPQFQQALSLFSSAFQTGQLAPLIRDFNLGDEAIAAATAGDLETFIKTLQEKKPQVGDENKAGDGPEDMALD